MAVGYNPAVFLRLTGPAIAGLELADLADAELSVGGELPRRPRIVREPPDTLEFTTLFDLRMLMGLLMGAGLEVRSRRLVLEVEMATVQDGLGRLVAAMQSDNDRLGETAFAHAEAMAILLRASRALAPRTVVPMTGEAAAVRYGDFDGALTAERGMDGAAPVHAALRVVPDASTDRPLMEAAFEALGDAVRNRADEPMESASRVPASPPARYWGLCRPTIGGVPRMVEYGVVARRLGGAYMVELGAAGDDDAAAASLGGLREAVLESCQSYEET